jgi:hypothetical protein
MTDLLLTFAFMASLDGCKELASAILLSAAPMRWSYLFSMSPSSKLLKLARQEIAKQATRRLALVKRVK